MFPTILRSDGAGNCTVFAIPERASVQLAVASTRVITLMCITLHFQVEMFLMHRAKTRAGVHTDHTSPSTRAARNTSNQSLERRDPLELPSWTRQADLQRGRWHPEMPSRLCRAESSMQPPRCASSASVLYCLEESAASLRLALLQVTLLAFWAVRWPLISLVTGMVRLELTQQMSWAGLKLGWKAMRKANQVPESPCSCGVLPLRFHSAACLFWQHC